MNHVQVVHARQPIRTETPDRYPAIWAGPKWRNSSALRRPASRFITGLCVVAAGVIGISRVLMASAPIFLAVDAARNLRAIRFGVR